MSYPDTGIRVRGSDGSDTDVEYVRVRPGDTQYDRTLVRPPYSNSWFLTGSGKQGPVTMAFSWDARSSTPAEDAREFVTLLDDAVFIQTPVGAFAAGGVMMNATIPAPWGYRVEATVLVPAGSVLPSLGVTYDGVQVTFGTGDVEWMGGE